MGSHMDATPVLCSSLQATLWTRASFQGIVGEENRMGFHQKTGGQAAETNCFHCATWCRRKCQKPTKPELIWEEITGTFQRAEKGNCILLWDLPPVSENSTISRLTFTVMAYLLICCLFRNTPSLNSSSAEGSVNIVELNVNSFWQHRHHTQLQI